MKLPRKLPRPSPSMIVALFALVIASTGTAVAAQSALIPGSRIVAHSITAKQLARGAVNHAALGSQAVKTSNFGGPAPFQDSTTVCANGTFSVGAPCPIGSYEGLLGGYSTTIVSIPAAGGVLTFYGPPSGAGVVASLQPIVQLTPNQPIQLSNLDVQIFGPPATNWPTSINVSMIVNGFPAGTAFCLMHPSPGGTNECHMDPSAAPTIIPADSSISFSFQVSNTGINPSWDKFDLAVGYMSSAAG